MDYTQRLNKLLLCLYEIEQEINNSDEFYKFLKRAMLEEFDYEMISINKVIDIDDNRNDAVEEIIRLADSLRHIDN